MMKQKHNASFMAPCRKPTRKKGEEDKEETTETEEQGRQKEEDKSFQVVGNAISNGRRMVEGYYQRG